jgi:hypothetical protein
MYKRLGKDLLEMKNKNVAMQLSVFDTNMKSKFVVIFVTE